MATIAENLQTILDIKNDIKSAIIAKGVSVADSDGFATYPSKIESIESGGTGGGADGFDFSIIGYDTTLNNSCNGKIQADIDYSKTIFDNWNPNTTSIYQIFQNDTKIVYCPQINTSKVTNMSNMFSGCTSLTTIPQLNCGNVTTMHSMFYNCSSLTTIPQLDTSNVSSMTYMFHNCSSLTTIPQLNTANVTNFASMFSSCISLTTIPQIDTTKANNMNSLFYNCQLLTTIPELNTSNVTDMGYLIYGCDIVHFPHLDTSNVTTFYRIMYAGNNNLVSIPLLDFGSVTNIKNFNGGSNKTYVTDLGGFKNLKIDWNDNYGLIKFPNLTYESVMNVINNLYDFRANGDTTTTRTIQFNANSKALLSDEDIAIATAKGWVIS